MATRKDVALKANVSVAAVSRALNQNGYVSEDKRQAVLRAARELGYTPNPVAVSLQQNKTKQILFYMQNTSNSYYMELYAGMLSFASTKGYLVLISGMMELTKIASLMIDGVIFSATTFLQEDLERHLRVPFVIASHGEKIPENVYTVVTDTGDAVTRAIAYLRARGHERIAFATFEATEDNRRIAAYRQEMRPVLQEQYEAYFLSIPIIMDRHDVSVNLFDVGGRAAEKFIRRKLNATAVICYNDDIAIGFNHQLQKCGFRVPEDISIVGLDGILVGRYMSPALTTFDIHPFHRGEKTAEMMIDLIEGNNPPARLRLPYSLREGASVCDRANA